MDLSIRIIFPDNFLEFIQFRITDPKGHPASFGHLSTYIYDLRIGAQPGQVHRGIPARPPCTGKSSARVYPSFGNEIILSCLPKTLRTARNEPRPFIADAVQDFNKALAWLQVAKQTGTAQIPFSHNPCSSAGWHPGDKKKVHNQLYY